MISFLTSRNGFFFFIYISHGSVIIYFKSDFMLMILKKVSQFSSLFYPSAVFEQSCDEMQSEIGTEKKEDLSPKNIDEGFPLILHVMEKANSTLEDFVSTYDPIFFLFVLV